MHMPSFSWKVFILVILVFLIGSLPSVYFFLQYQKTQRLLSDPTEASRVDLQMTLNAVGKLMKLPPNEEPSVAIISDKEQLKSQPFFATAENGDKIIIYRNARKAILYRPSVNKIIDVAPVTLNSPIPTPPTAVNADLETPTPEATDSAFP